MSTTLGIDIGGTAVKAVALDAAGAELGRWTAPSSSPGDAAAPACAHAVRGLLEKIAMPGAKIGLAAPGLAARDGRSIASMPGRMDGLAGFVWGDFLGQPVPVMNDAHAALLGELRHGAARGMGDVAMITLGTGVGGAIASGGRVLTGAGGRAGHIGHMSLDPFGAPTIGGMPGGLENWIGNHNIAERSGGRFATTHELVDAYTAGDAHAAEVWLRSIRALGCAISSLVNVLDPEAVLIGGGIARAGAALFDPLQHVLDETEWRPAGLRVKLLAAGLGEWAGAHGAAVLARGGI